MYDKFVDAVVEKTLNLSHDEGNALYKFLLMVDGTYDVGILDNKKPEQCVEISMAFFKDFKISVETTVSAIDKINEQYNDIINYRILLDFKKNQRPIQISLQDFSYIKNELKGIVKNKFNNEDNDIYELDDIFILVTNFAQGIVQ